MGMKRVHHRIIGTLPIYRQQRTDDPNIGTLRRTDDPYLCSDDPLPHRLYRALCPVPHCDGARHDLHDALKAAGVPLRVLVPYGEDWYGYFMRRLAERPANIVFLLRNLMHS